ncbi:hypothetical protein H7J86_18560 [Mycobacterium hackensackense]|uniref:hypothetical protein n=1 Tax=Mycobacterium hackensackense TaxID=228909 RepID=UPI0022658D46|nr:hypothetical protein [Mycobacterium hackensackense]MCV7254167.1 hypothetical protein [Mycobacterium hackensackense]
MAKPTYWVEIALSMAGGRGAVDKFIAVLDERHQGDVIFTYAPTDNRLTIGMSTTSDFPIEGVVAEAVYTVRAAADGLGLQSPSQPDPVVVDNVSIRELSSVEARPEAQGIPAAC